jgi:hypothetical protein
MWPETSMPWRARWPLTFGRIYKVAAKSYMVAIVLMSLIQCTIYVVYFLYFRFHSHSGYILKQLLICKTGKSTSILS